MRKTIYLLIIFPIVLVCSKDKNIVLPTKLDKPSAMIVCCQASLDDTVSLVKYEYTEDRLITETLIQNGELHSKTTFEYNPAKLIVSEIYLSSRQKIEKTFVYNETEQLINVIYIVKDYDSNGQLLSMNESEAPREYENNLLVKEWEIWGGFITYEYTSGKIATKINYTKNGEKHHTTRYTYSGDLLTEEKKETSIGTQIYLRKYKYDSQNRLISIQDGENIIEENEYIDNKLIEKREYYFGIDPCFAQCCSNFTYKFEY